MVLEKNVCVCVCVCGVKGLRLDLLNEKYLGVKFPNHGPPFQGVGNCRTQPQFNLQNRSRYRSDL